MSDYPCLEFPGVWISSPYSKFPCGWSGYVTDGGVYAVNTECDEQLQPKISYRKEYRLENGSGDLEPIRGEEIWEKKKFGLFKYWTCHSHYE